MPLIDRSLIRLEISAVLDTITSIQTNTPYPPLKLGGESPISFMANNGAAIDWASRDHNIQQYGYLITLAVNRKAHGAEAAETLLDSVYTDIAQALRDVGAGTNFQFIVMGPGPSRPFFATIDGIPYRIEEIPIVAQGNP